MLILNNNELLEIMGGLNVTGALINSFTRGLNTILDIARSLGSAIRRIYDGKLCSL